MPTKPNGFDADAFNAEDKWGRGYVLSARDAYHTIEQAQYLWCVDCAASVGDSVGLGMVNYGDAVVTAPGGERQIIDGGSAWLVPDDPAMDYFTRNQEPPIVPGLASDVANLEFEAAQDTQLGIAGLITLVDANGVLVLTFKELWRRFYAKMVILNGGTPRGYRAWSHIARSGARMKVYEKGAFANLCAACLPKHKRKGLQTISTRKTDIPAQGVFQFNGRWAYAYRRGRPAMSESAWLAKERARNVKRRKNPMRTRRDSRKLHVPPTKYPRPTWRVNATEKRNKTVVKSYSPPDVERLLEWREQSEICAMADSLELLALA